MKNQEAFGHICRHCYNDLTGVYLRHRDCRYIPGAHPCQYCGNPQAHLIQGVNLRGRLRLLFKLAR